MTWDEMQTLARDQLPNYMKDGKLDRTKFVRDVRKNYGLSQDLACKLVDGLNVDSRRPRTKAR